MTSLSRKTIPRIAWPRW